MESVVQFILFAIYCGVLIGYLLPVGGDTKEAMREHRMDDYRSIALLVVVFVILWFFKMFDKIF